MDRDYFDVMIIGGGVVGCAVARELSRYRLKSCVLEKSIDLAAGASRANTGLVHAGFDPQPGTVKARLNIEGHRLYEDMVSELNVPYRRNGALVVALDEGDVGTLEELKKRGEQNGVEQLRILQASELKQLVPVLTPDACAALFAPTAGIVSPYELVFALAENAYANGIQFCRAAGVSDIEFPGENEFRVITSAGEFRSKIVVNAAGRHSDQIAGIAGENGFEILPRRGEYLLLDKKCEIPLEQTLFPLPTKMGKGVVVTPTVPGNILVGPNAEDIRDRSDLTTTEEGLEHIFASASRLVPSMSKRHIITNFAGIRTISSTGDFIIGPTKVSGFINAAGIMSPGLTAAPAIAKLVVEHIKTEMGLDALPENSNFDPLRHYPGPFAGMDLNTRTEQINEHPGNANMVCRCEHVTEVEVLAAIRTRPGASTVDGIKLRTRAGMGRCQGGYCTDRVMKLISTELNIPLTEITKHEPGSYILSGRTKVRGEEKS